MSMLVSPYPLISEGTLHWDLVVVPISITMNIGSNLVGIIIGSGAVVIKGKPKRSL